MLFCNICEKTCCKYSFRTLGVSDTPLSSQHLPGPELCCCPHCSDSKWRPGNGEGCKGSLWQKHSESSSTSYPKQASVSQTTSFLSIPSVLTPNPGCREQEGIAQMLWLQFRGSPQQCLDVTPQCAGKPQPGAQPRSCARASSNAAQRSWGRVNQKSLRLIQPLQRAVSVIKVPPSRAKTLPSCQATWCTAPVARR